MQLACEGQADTLEPGKPIPVFLDIWELIIGRDGDDDWIPTMTQGSEEKGDGFSSKMMDRSREDHYL
jgi:hypothetical protein